MTALQTYFQSGTQPTCQQEEGQSGPNCPPAYADVTPGAGIDKYKPAPVLWNEKLNNGTTPVKPGITTQILATESCMGCHSSAGIYTSYTDKKTFTRSGQLTGDFSWLMVQKAQSNPNQH